MPALLTETFGSYGPLIIPLLRMAGVLAAGYILFRLTDSALKRLPPIVFSGVPNRSTRIEQRAETLRHVMRSAARIAVIVMVLLTVLSELGVSVAGVLASVGVVSLAIGFGAQFLVKDVISGFFILFEDQFGVGDVVRIGTYSGVVEHMTLRITVLRNLEGEVHIIPNGNIQSVSVMTKDWSRAVLDITVAYTEDITRVFEAINRVGVRLAQDWPDRVIEPPVILGIEKLSSDGIAIRAVAKTPPMKQWEVVREWRKRIKEEFDREGIEVPRRISMIQGPEEKREARPDSAKQD